MKMLHQRASLALFISMLSCGHNVAENYEGLIIRVDAPGATNGKKGMFLSHMTRGTYATGQNDYGNAPEMVSMIVSDRPQLFDAFRVEQAENGNVHDNYLLDNYYFLTSQCENERLNEYPKRLRDGTLKQEQNEVPFRSIRLGDHLLMHAFNSKPINYRSHAASFNDVVYGFHEARELGEQTIRHVISASSLEENWHQYLMVGPAPMYLIGFTSNWDEATRFHLMALYEHVHLVTYRGFDSTNGDPVDDANDYDNEDSQDTTEAGLDSHFLHFDEEN